ncbi:dephospho-CoA kinase [Litorilituus lipolyticus]|uniref:Dephospho-CoA kinase n=1 Tax=Litorilituus lipolyticus TaxID=2491017 RepID=A0A502KKH0_9GAMM|nr:dephospho-CoA kinase [Litorilituus lipolyticus]TPH12048.1 dephospho-CoA kinase [Litorilituus lipolyticus]
MSSYIVGLTGGIGSGKTTVSDQFNALGVSIIDADIIAREVVAPKSQALGEISHHFGEDFINQDGSLNRALLRSRIFSNEEDKHWLNSLLHPLIRQKIQEQCADAKSKYCILVAPLLIENNLLQLVDRVLVVDVSETIQLERTLQRDCSNEEEVRSIINSQAQRKDRLAHANDIINNEDIDLSLLNESIRKLHHEYLTLASDNE